MDSPHPPRQAQCQNKQRQHYIFHILNFIHLSLHRCHRIHWLIIHVYIFILRLIMYLQKLFWLKLKLLFILYGFQFFRQTFPIFNCTVIKCMTFWTLTIRNRRWLSYKCFAYHQILYWRGERGGSVVECRTPEREVRGSRPTSAVLCPWARHFTPRKYWLITQEAMAPSRHDWKIVDWDVKPQHNQPILAYEGFNQWF